MIQVAGFRDEGSRSGFNLGFKVEGLGLRVQGSGGVEMLMKGWLKPRGKRGLDAWFGGRGALGVHLPAAGAE